MCWQVSILSFMGYRVINQHLDLTIDIGIWVLESASITSGLFWSLGSSQIDIPEDRHWMEFIKVLSLQWPPLTSNQFSLPPLPHILNEVTFCLRPYLPNDGLVGEKRLDVTVDKYVIDVSNVEMWINLQILTSVYKSLYWIIDVIQDFSDLVLLI